MYISISGRIELSYCVMGTINLTQVFTKITFTVNGYLYSHSLYREILEEGKKKKTKWIIISSSPEKTQNNGI